jgi:chemotaxis protein MotA
MKHTFDISTVLGIFIAFALIGIAVTLDPNARFSSFFDLGSMLIVIGGTLAVTIACFSLGELLRALLTTGRTIFYRSGDPSEVGTQLIELAEEARKNGILTLQNFLIQEDNDPFLVKGLRMVVDGMESDHAEHILKHDIHAMVDRHARGASVLRKCAETAPAMGLIGTLIGLVQMLTNLNDPSKIGTGMATALLTTLYGAMFAYLFFAPLAAKLERNSKEEVLLNTLYIKGIHSIGKKENPRRLEMLLNSILPPSKRIDYFKD